MGASERRTIRVGDAVVTSDGMSIPVRTERAAQVARWFGLDASKSVVNRSTRAMIPAAVSGTVTYLYGPSGAGKSTLLRAMRDECGNREWIDMNAIELPVVPLVDCFGDTPLREALVLLARIGLGEAWSYLRTPSELSDGQRWRMKLAMALHRARFPHERPAVIACDEFGALLDRVTSMIVSRCLRRMIDANPHLCAIVATSHDDLEPALRPDLVGWCDFGKVEWARRTIGTGGRS